MITPVITVDGASGTGKGTVSQRVAQHLGWHLLDSGALYRVLGLAAQKQHIALDNEDALSQLALTLNVTFHFQLEGAAQVVLAGEDVSEAIRTEEIGNAASIVGALPAVRKALLERQRAFKEAPGLVADGRDMGTIVFPDAPLKIFLTASAEERAARRHKQLIAKGVDATLAELIEQLRERDKRDTERLVAPLKPAVDAICIDTDHLSVEQVAERILNHWQEKAGEGCSGKKAFPVTEQMAMNNFAPVLA
jgi:cytidylate kinase